MALSEPIPAARPIDFPSFAEEAADLRSEIMTSGVLGPAIILGWVTALITLTLEHKTIDWVELLIKIAVTVVAVLCAALRRGRTAELSLWLCGIGLWLLAALNLAHTPSTAQAIWLLPACFGISLLLGGWVGWIAVAMSLGLLVWLQTQVPGIDPHILSLNSSILTLGLVLVMGTWLVQHVANVLFRTLRWMIEGYAAARARAQSLSETSAELTLTLKNLQQTSQTLAHANEQLQVLVHYAEDARRSKQEFAANVSHELRTPLNLIIGFSDLMLRAPTAYAANLPPGLSSDIKVVHRNAHHLLNLINDILDLSQMDVNHMTIMRESMQLGEFIETALVDFRELIRVRGLSLSIDIATDLPAIYADRTRVRQVLLNLVANALRFTEQGGITIRVSQQDQTLVISVSDTGIGIAPKDLQRIFEPFTQADGALGRKHGGTGLGLTISKEFVELHGGRMWVTSVLGQGSNFSFSLPIHVPIPESPILPARRSDRTPGDRTLVVIEPGMILSRILAHQLEGIIVLRCASPAALYAQHPEVQPDVILLNQPGLLPISDSIGATFNTVDKVNTFNTVNTDTIDIQAALDRCQQDWPASWRTVPVLHCYVPGPEAYLQSGQVRRFLTKPITQDEFNDALTVMLTPIDLFENTAVTNRPQHNRMGRVLLIEDDEDALRLLSRMLRAAPLEVRGPFQSLLPLEARSGEQALEIIQSLMDRMGEKSGPEHPNNHQIDAVILDLGLGTISGQDVLRVLSENPHLRHLPVCVVSGQQLRTEPLVSTHLTLFKPKGHRVHPTEQPHAPSPNSLLPSSPLNGGLVARELAEAIKALLPVALMGPGGPKPESDN